jgi:hypothetical protein
LLCCWVLSGCSVLDFVPLLSACCWVLSILSRSCYHHHGQAQSNFY